MKKNYLSIVLYLIGALNLMAQSTKEEQLRAFVEKALEEFSMIPGISVAVSNHEGTIYSRGFGYADIENKVKANEKTNFYIASCTKSFNGLLASILESEGKIDLKEQIINYKPFSAFTNRDLFNGITVMDLLSHQSGLDNEFLSFKLAYSGDYTQDQILDLIENESIANENGKSFEYTNYGYYLLDVLLQAELGESWKDLLKERVFNPIGMEQTTAYMSEVSANQLALPYNGVNADKVEKSRLMKTDETMHAAGGLVSTADDISKFLSFYLNEGNVNGNQLYSKELVKGTYSQQTEATNNRVEIFDIYGYATGWRLGKFNDLKAVHHFGGYVGYFSHMSFLPEKDLGVAVFVNHGMGALIGNLIAEYAYNLYLENDEALKNNHETLESKLPQMLESFRQRMDAHQKKMAERTWQLSLDKEKYAGLYHNYKLGTVEVSLVGDQITVKYGNLIADATPYPTENTMRVELVPGSGSVIGFNLVDSEVKSVSYKSDTFTKIN